MASIFVRTPIRITTKNGRKKVRRKQKRAEEATLQIFCVKWFYQNDRLRDVIGWHVPNGEHRSISVAVKLKEMGVLPGVFDWHMFFANGTYGVIEFKSTTGTLSQDQEIFENLMSQRGALTGQANNFDDFKRLCLEWHALDRARPKPQRLDRPRIAAA